MKWYIHGCPVCGGALHDSEDKGWVECLMCARSFRESEVASEPESPLALAGFDRRIHANHISEDQRHPQAA